MKNLVEPIKNKKQVEAVEKYLEKQSKRNQLIWTFGVNSGLRISDILGLNVEDVENKTFVEVREKKTGKYKRFPLNKKLRVLIKEYLVEREKVYSITDDNPLFVGKKHKRLDRSQVYRFLNYACQQLGIDINVGTHTIERLADLRSKQTILSIMKNSCILFDEAEDVMIKSLYGDKFHSKAFLNTIIENTPVPILWTTNNIYNVDPAILRRMTYTIQFEKLSEDTRLNIWKNILKKNQFKVEKNKLIELNRKYEISPSIISNAVKTTKLIGGTSDDFSDFIESVTQVVKKKKNVQKKADFDMSKYNDSLVNADLDVTDLTEKIQACGNLNFSLCLYGEPGTGKSLYAKYLANRLGIECIHKRVSDLMSKWVGETEQNIADAFAEARSKKAMLIFDEADSFLQTRGNAQRSWEISQVNEMLTQMETHEYPFVCTTNLLDTLDEASLRRFTFKIKFDFMTKEQVNTAFEDFFGVKNANVNIKGLTAGDFATVSKKANFLKITDKDELIKMLNDEVKVKKSESLKRAVGF